MTIWTVFVYDGLNHRFIDTSWAREDAAQKRAGQIEMSMKATIFGGSVKIFQMQVEDCLAIEGSSGGS